MKKPNFRALLASTVVACGLFAAGSAAAAVDMFLKLGGIKGESVARGHEGDIEVLAWSWGTSTGTARTTKGLLPAACVQDLSVTKFIDAATPQIIINGVTGAVVPEAVLAVRKAGDRPTDFLVLRMYQVRVVSYTTGGSGGEDRLTENVTIRFDSLRGEYRRQSADGSYLPPVTFDVTGGVCK